MIKPIFHQVKFVILLLIDILLRIKKFCEYIKSGKHEFERICESHGDIYEKTIGIDNWLKSTNCKRIRECLDSIGPSDRVVQAFVECYCGGNQHHQHKSKLRQKKKSQEQNISSQGQPTNIEDSDIRLLSHIRMLTDNLVKTIKDEKNTKLSRDNEKVLSDTIFRIISYKLTLSIASKLASTKYDAENVLHAKKLMSLWNNLVKNDDGSKQLFPSNIRHNIVNEAEIVSNRWSHIGFQGEDPGTDFRGMGILGLIQLEYLSRRSKNLPQDLLRRSLDEAHSYPMAIVGINITFNLLNLFKDGSMKHLYYDTNEAIFRSTRKKLNLMTIFNDLYVEMFLRFDCFWHESKPENIFAFRELMEKFVGVIRADLSNRNFSFKFIY